MMWLLPAGVAVVVGGLAVLVGRAGRAEAATSIPLDTKAQSTLMAQQMMGYLRERTACGGAPCPRADRLLAAVIRSATLLNLPQFVAAIQGGGSDQAINAVTEVWPHTNIPIPDYIKQVILPEVAKRAGGGTPSPMAPKG